MLRQHLLGLLCPALLLAVSTPPAVAAGEPVRVEVPADRAWTATGIVLDPGTPLHVEARGRARMVGMRLWDWLTGLRVDRKVGPEGTYVWPRRLSRPGHDGGAGFPLPSVTRGPWPAYALIGKIGADGPPFYVGARYDGTASRSGELWLGVNDDDPEDNGGAFDVTVELSARPAPVPAAPPSVAPGRVSGRPMADARVLVIYIDGLRVDVLEELAASGSLPNLKAAFLDPGLRVPHMFTVFPSNTIVTNASLLTGRFPDGTGVKSQNQFERLTQRATGVLSEWMPNWWYQRFRPAVKVIDLLDTYAPENTHAFLIGRRVPTLASRMGKAYKFTTMPIVPLNPPPYWFHRAVNTIGPFGISVRLPGRIDTVNAQYAIEELIGDPDARVLTVWFPMLDKVSHYQGRGQFGPARRDLVLADRAVGRILERLREVGWADSTYLILISDHGHLGGQTAVNKRAHLARDWAHLELGCNARVVGDSWSHPGIPDDRFVFLDHQGAGQAKIFLPRGHCASGPWERNRLRELTDYGVSGRRRVDLIKSLTDFGGPEWRVADARPVDLVLVKLDSVRILVHRTQDNQAVIHRQRGPDGRDTFRYEPVRRLAWPVGGPLSYDPAEAGLDPLGYLEDPAFLERTGGPAWLSGFHDDRAWLAATHRTRYPDAVVAFSKFFAWQPFLEDLAAVRDPDLVVTAAEGWSFRSDGKEGTDHGYPLADSMRMVCAISGPNVTPGVWQAPQRVIDLVPTILSMIGRPYDPESMDGRAMADIYAQ
ncbi:MAG TPA: alkaline phosphatase family protein [bacterium]